jgi:hypothetical protein
MKKYDDQQQQISDLQFRLSVAQAVEGWLTERNDAGAFDTPELQQFYDRELAKIRERGRATNDEITKLRLGK